MSASRVAIVTGASSGVGRAIALGLLEEGRRVVLVGRRRGPLEQVAEGWDDRAIVHPADVGEPAAAAAILGAARAAAERAGGRVDTLVNNAGVAALVPLPETTEEWLDEALAVNLRGPIRLVQAAWPDLTASGAGRIVNLSSTATLDPFPGFLAYAAAKSALESVTRSAAIEGAEAGIKAWTVAPGAIETPMLRGLVDESVVPKEAAMDPAEVAGLVLALLRDERDEASGATVRLSGPGAEPTVD